MWSLRIARASRGSLRIPKGLQGIHWDPQGFRWIFRHSWDSHQLMESLRAFLGFLVALQADSVNGRSFKNRNLKLLTAPGGSKNASRSSAELLGNEGTTELLLSPRASNVKAM